MAGPTQHTDAPSTALVPSSASAVLMAAGKFDEVWRMSKALAQSGSFKDIGRAGLMPPDVLKVEASKALARIMLGADLGMSPTQALMGIDIVKGNPQIRGVALGRMVRESEQYDYAVLDRDFTEGAESATVALYRRDESGAWPVVEDEEGETFPTSVGPVTIRKGKRLPEAVEAFKLDQAKKRGLVKTDGAWDTQPEVMVVWRALSQLVRFYAPDVIGGMPVYTEADGLRPEVIGGEDASEPGWQGLSPEQIEAVERMMARAAEVEHAGLADRHTAQRVLNGKTPEQVTAWLESARIEIIDAEAKRAASVDGTAEEVKPDAGEAFVDGPAVSDAERADELDRRADVAGEQAQEAADRGDDDEAAALSAESDGLRQEAEAIRSGQTTLGLG